MPYKLKLSACIRGAAAVATAVVFGALGCEQPRKAEPTAPTEPESGLKAFVPGPTPVAARLDDDAAAAIGEGRLPRGYRDWRLISVAREEGAIDDIRAILGSDVAIKAYREGTRPFPDGTVIARVAWSYVPSEANNKAFGRPQSFVAGRPKNGVQFMVKDATRYASTGGWGYSQFDDGKPTDAAALKSCYACHAAQKDHDFVFTHYAP